MILNDIKYRRINLMALVVALSMALASAAVLTTPGVLAGNRNDFTTLYELEELLEAAGDRIRLFEMRVYLPQVGRENVELPTFTYVSTRPGGRRFTLPTCPWIDSVDANWRPVRRLFARSEDNLPRILRKIARIARVPRNQGGFPFCGWWTVTDIDTFNIIFPDSNATYWVMPLIASAEFDVEIDGVYPDARYMSLVLYNDKLDFYEYLPDSSKPEEKIPSFTVDYKIDPIESGSNPFQNDDGKVGAAYKVTIKWDPQFGEPNVLPWQDNGDQDQELEVGASSFPIPPPCGRENSESPCPVETQFVSAPTHVQSGITSNPDVGYLAALVTLDRPDRVYVIRGQAPRTPQVEVPVPWSDDTMDYDMRYWSLCSSIYLRPYPTVTGQFPPEIEDGRYKACLADLQVLLDEDDFFTIVVSTEKARPQRIQQEPNVVWIKGVLGPKILINLRHMLPSNEFSPNAVQSVPRTGSFVDAMDTMDWYYPLITVACTTSQYEENGWGGCVAPKE